MASPNRRGTLFPGSSSVQSLGKRSASDNDSSPRLSASQILEVPKALTNKRRALPLALPVKVKTDSQFYTTSARFPRPNPPVRSEPISCESDPWEEYYAVLDEDQAGDITVAYKKEIKHPIVAIRRIANARKEDLKKVSRSCHENIVSLHKVHFQKEALYFVYESMDVSLAEIQSTPYGKLAEYHIATICKEVSGPSMQPSSADAWHRSQAASSTSTGS